MTSSSDSTSAARVLDEIRSGGLVPLYSSADVERLYRVAEAIVGAGIAVLEVTLRTPGALDAMAQLIKRVEADGMPLIVGAGTVLDIEAADGAIEAGAGFVFSPVVDPEVAARCHADRVAWIPGCATPTEIHTATRLGCTAVKLFPADTIGGPGFLRSVRSVFPDVVAIPSGGVVPDPVELGDWFRAGATALALGSWLFPAAGAEDDWVELARRLESAVSNVAMARAGLSK